MGKKDNPAAGTSGGQGAGNQAAESLAPGSINENAPGPAATSNQSPDTGSTGDGASLAGAGADDANLGVSKADVASTVSAAIVSAVSAATWIAKSIPAISVTAHRDGYRRAGRAWSKRETAVAFSDFDEEQIRQLRLDPNLTVRGVYIDAEPDGDQQ